MGVAQLSTQATRGRRGGLPDMALKGGWARRDAIKQRSQGAPARSFSLLPCPDRQ